MTLEEIKMHCFDFQYLEDGHLAEGLSIRVYLWKKYGSLILELTHSTKEYFEIINSQHLYEYAYSLRPGSGSVVIHSDKDQALKRVSDDLLMWTLIHTKYKDSKYIKGMPL
ncbi:hypothetical protein [Pedobacter sp.]|uniref:hypothetical protein n=1 Tax=Pedobacter sp. TaxID=1411316 RepID=UPI003C372DC8